MNVAGLNFDTTGLAHALAGLHGVPERRPEIVRATSGAAATATGTLRTCVYCRLRSAALEPDGPGKWCCADGAACEARILDRKARMQGRPSPSVAASVARETACASAELVRTKLQLDVESITGEPSVDVMASGSAATRQLDHPTAVSDEAAVLSGPLVVGNGIGLPLDAVLARYVVLAKSGAGKTNATTVMAEEFFRAGFPVWQLDPLGNLWGQRSSLDGQGPGLAIPIFGGPHGDMHLPDARLLCRALVSNKMSAIMDLSELSLHEQRAFAEEFCDELIRAAKETGIIGHLFGEEGDRFAPNTIGENLVKTFARVARNVSIGWTFATQRGQILSPDITESANVVVAMKMGSGLAQEAIGKKVSGLFESRAELKATLESLPRLKKGEAVFMPDPDWTPDLEEDARPTRFRYRWRSTFDATAPRRVGVEPPVAKVFADVDLEALRATLDGMGQPSAAIAEEGTPPEASGVIAELQERIAELEDELARLRGLEDAGRDEEGEDESSSQPAAVAWRGKGAGVTRGDVADASESVLRALLARYPLPLTPRPLLRAICGLGQADFESAVSDLRAADLIEVRRGRHGGIGLASRALKRYGLDRLRMHPRSASA